MARRRHWERVFLAALSQTGVVRDATAVARIDRTTAYKARANDPVFAEAWDVACEDAADAAEAEAWRRAVEGVDKPVFQGGLCVGTIREYSDGLLTLILKARRPEKYRERHHVSAEVTHHDGDSRLDQEIGALMDQLERLGEGPAALGGADPDRTTNGHAPRPTGATGA